jgi:hypothetical protein
MTPEVTLFVDPPTHHFLGDRLFEAEAARLGGDNLLAPHIAVRDHFRSHGIAVHTADRFPRLATRVNLLVSLGRAEAARTWRDDPRLVRSAFFAMECPIVEPTLYRALPEMADLFARVYCWTDGDSLLPFTRTPVPSDRFFWPQSVDAVDLPVWSRTERKFLAMINANKLPRLPDRELYTERLRAVAFFQSVGDIDLYGKNWDRMPNRVGRTWVPATARRLHGWLWRHWQRVRPDPLYRAAREANRGPVDRKIDTLGHYRFALCFENMRLRGWITEKLFDCLAAGTVPIYWGATDIEEWVDPACYIDMRRFPGYADLHRYLRGLGAEKVTAYRDAGRAFLASSRFDRFRIRAWVDRFRQIVRDDAGVET